MVYFQNRTTDEENKGRVQTNNSSMEVECGGQNNTVSTSTQMNVTWRSVKGEFLPECATKSAYI